MYKNLCEIVLQSNPITNTPFPFLKAIFTPHRISFAPALKPDAIGLLFTHKNGDLCAISVRKRSCAALISKIESHISDTIFLRIIAVPRLIASLDRHRPWNDGLLT